MSTDTQTQPDVVTLTEAAAREITTIIDQQGLDKE